ncbi:beta-1 adrenergic receptor-like [Dendronephthya gigantea]|uniref:beta-1 adrenergic receptor-like n=1 Tax=Dendronephthya gigantea TaxID=151771 RepID=UPI00106D8B2C|nr:beta-1 adrenergic receptor-like [Dendronephthya gigantea]
MDNTPANKSEPPLDQTAADTVVQVFTMSVIIILSVFFNAVVLICFYRHHALQTFTNAFVVNLACADFLFGLLGMPLSLVTSITIDYAFPVSVCKFHGFVLVLFSEASIWTLTFVSFERYLSIRHPFHHQRWITPSVVTTTIGAVWAISILFALLPFGISKYSFYRFNHICVADWRISFQTTLIYCICSIFIPFTFMVISNIGILKTALEQNRKVDVKVGNIRKMTIRPSEAPVIDVVHLEAERKAAEKAKARKKKEKRATLLVLAIVGTFALCWIPYAITSMCLMIRSYECLWSSRVFVASAWLTNLSSALNPILYIVFNVTIRRAVKQLLGISPKNGVDGSDGGTLVTNVTRFNRRAERSQ